MHKTVQNAPPEPLILTSSLAVWGQRSAGGGQNNSGRRFSYGEIRCMNLRLKRSLVMGAVNRLTKKFSVNHLVN